MKTFTVAIFATLALILAGCGSTSDAATKDKPVASKTVKAKKGDAQAVFACRNFRKMANDVNDGLLNDAELRKAVQKIQGDARLSETPGIKAGATRLLAANTAGDSDGFLLAVSQFNDACKAAKV